MRPCSPLWILLLVAGPSTSWPQAPAELAVTFQLNDALIKDELLPGVQIRLVRAAAPDAGLHEPLLSAETDAAGKLQVKLPAGDYLATYRKPGYVPIEDSRVAVHTAGQVVTTSLTPMLESGAGRQRVVRVVLNWGSDSSQVKDADAHLAPKSGGADQEVYYMEKRFAGPGLFSIALDVDDVDWGGPETITLTEPPPGDYLYWVHNYSGGSSLGESEVVVRVFIDDRLAGEYRAPENATERYFRPFAAIRVDPDLAASVVAFEPQAIVESAHLNKPPGPWSDPGDMDCDGCEAVGSIAISVIFLTVWLAFRKRRR